MFKSRLKSLIGGIAFAAAATLIPAIASADSDKPIKIAVNDWTGQHISAHLAGQLLVKAGYKVEYVTAGAVPQFAAMTQGDINLQPETWSNNVGEIYPKAVADGKIAVIGELGLTPQEGWIFPPYMKEKCPGLPDYKALYDCAKEFGTPETFPKGRLITYPADWGTRSKDLVKLIGVPLQPVAGGSEGAMIAELKSAMAEKKPILMMFWQPHWVFAEHDMEWIKWDPTPEGKECHEEKGQSKGQACGFKQADIKKVASSNLKEDWPGAYKLVEMLKLTNDAQNTMIHSIDQKKMKVEDVVAKWVADNEATWKPWVEAAKGAMKN